MIATVILLAFMLMTQFMKTASIRLIKEGKSHGVFVLLAIKMLFWLSIVEIFYIWAPKTLLFVLPSVLVLFLLYVYMERKILVQAIIGKPFVSKFVKKQPEISFEADEQKY